MNREARFLVYLIENYKQQKGLNGRAVAALFKQHKVYDFVIEMYDLLHVEGPRANEYIIDEYLERAGITPPKRVLTGEASYL
ncbi:hypothetical protein AGMMS4957_22490 [Bacteroidia bacterium]|nr:hypothetical protein AGMMS4957_22490 [Bacteroidia bacterium]